MFNKRIVNFATTVEGPPTQQPKECINNVVEIHDKMFGYPTNLTEVSNEVVS